MPGPEAGRATPAFTGVVLRKRALSTGSRDAPTSFRGRRRAKRADRVYLLANRCRGRALGAICVTRRPCYCAFSVLHPARFTSACSRYGHFKSPVAPVTRTRLLPGTRLKRSRCCFTGAEPQVVPAAHGAHLPRQLHAAPARAVGLPRDQRRPSRPRLPALPEVSLGARHGPRYPGQLLNEPLKVGERGGRRAAAPPPRAPEATDARL